MRKTLLGVLLASSLTVGTTLWATGRPHSQDAENANELQIQTDSISLIRRNVPNEHFVHLRPGQGTTLDWNVIAALVHFGGDADPLRNVNVSLEIIDQRTWKVHALATKQDGSQGGAFVDVLLVRTTLGRR